MARLVNLGMQRQHRQQPIVTYHYFGIDRAVPVPDGVARYT
jgi:hypothetical protein